MSTAPAPARLTGWQAGALVVGSMIGTGVFTASGTLVGMLGSRSAVLLVWLVGGIAALCGALVYAELGAMLPRVGGEYVYVTRAFPPVFGFISGWLGLLAGFSAPVAAGAAAFGRYLAAAFPGVPVGLGGPVLIVAVTALHARDVAGAGRLQLGVTALNVAAMLGLCGVGGFALLGHAPAPEVAEPGVSAPAFAAALVVVSYSYFGWNAAAYVAGELATPQRSLPRALVVGCLLVTGLYVALNAVFLAALPAAALAGKIEVAHVVATALLGEGAARALSLLITVVLAGSVSALTMTGPRSYLAMAEDGAFPRLFAQRNRRGAPAAGVLLQGALALIMVATTTFDALLVYVGFTLSLSAAATVAAAAWLRHKEPELPRPFRTPGWPVTPLIFFALALWMTAYAVQDRPRESAAGALSVAAGAVIYAFWQRRRRIT